ncbi:conserved protein of unknown function [Acidithiobacillus ferrivorans]|uniref:DUF1845 domain-containing protein n=1 Tax=Acidithiobacillus ferrivorans TaxID=160808 RepID=A0A060ULE4_9PROT|nr:hypothetical protein [Acidithiobacillus ferrivorans]CDQ09176.1 conserved hypothetical protein [Acidithiobacillus ferrivorans]SMH64845.1 conserved protein of unknown function [Acidithiobacillus ferrivorans]
MEVENVTESTVSDSQATTATAEKKPEKASGNNRPGKKRPQFMLPMADIPEGKKTSSRAGIKRTVSLKSRNTQDLFFRTYGFLSEANYFLEIVAPGLASTHPDKPEHATLVRQFQELTRDNMKNVRESVAMQIQMVREAMENNGIDPDSNAMVFTEPLNEDAVITSHLDSEFLSILESVDTLVGLRGLGSIFSVFSAAEMGAMEHSLRREILSIYRTALRNSRIAMQAAMGRYHPRPSPDAAAIANAHASDAAAPTIVEGEPIVSTEATEEIGATADVDGTPVEQDDANGNVQSAEETEEHHPRKRGNA